MDLKEIQQRNYDATVKRGKITKHTTVKEFTDKIKEETYEIIGSVTYDYKFIYIDGLEVADVIIVCLNMAKYFGIDIQKALEEKTIINENRIK